MGEVVRMMKRGKFVGFYLRYYDAEGRRRMRASGETTHAAALLRLREIEGAEATTRRSGKAAVLKAVQPKAAPRTVAALCEAYLADSHLHVKDAAQYRKKSAYSLKPLLALLGHLQLTTLHRRDIEKARDVLSRRLKPNSVRAVLRPLSAAFSWAVREELIAASPMAKLRQPRRTASTQRLSEEEATALLAQTHGALHIAIALGLRLGLRRGEIFGLRWQDVDLRRARVTVSRSYQSSTKNGKPRTLPLSPTMLTALNAWRAQQPLGCVQICPMGPAAQRTLTTLLHEVTGRLFDRPWHTLRHTFASLFIESGGSILSLKDLLGHSSLEMSLLYNHIAPAAMAADMAKLKI